MNNEQIEYMAKRFLGWKLPKNFNPDNGISFKPTFNDHLPEPMKRDPSGTNLFDYMQAVEMVRYMIEGLPIETAKPPAPAEERLFGILQGYNSSNMPALPTATPGSERLVEALQYAEVELTGWLEHTCVSHSGNGAIPVFRNCDAVILDKLREDTQTVIDTAQQALKQHRKESGA